jgi:hypothetical protein
MESLVARTRPDRSGRVTAPLVIEYFSCELNDNFRLWAYPCASNSFQGAFCVSPEGERPRLSRPGYAASFHGDFACVHRHRGDWLASRLSLARTVPTALGVEPVRRALGGATGAPRVAGEQQPRRRPPHCGDLVRAHRRRRHDPWRPRLGGACAVSAVGRRGLWRGVAAHAIRRASAGRDRRGLSGAGDRRQRRHPHPRRRRRLDASAAGL